MEERRRILAVYARRGLPRLGAAGKHVHRRFNQWLCRLQLWTLMVRAPAPPGGLPAAPAFLACASSLSLPRALSAARCHPGSRGPRWEAAALPARVGGDEAKLEAVVKGECWAPGSYGQTCVPVPCAFAPRAQGLWQTGAGIQTVLVRSWSLVLGLWADVLLD